MPVLRRQVNTIPNMVPSGNSNQVVVPAGFQQSYSMKIQVFIPSGPVGYEVKGQYRSQRVGSLNLNMLANVLEPVAACIENF